MCVGETNQENQKPNRHDREIEFLWNDYVTSIDFNTDRQFTGIQETIKRFGSLDYIQKHFKMTPEIHFIGNVLAHYLIYTPPLDSKYSLDSWDVVTFVWFSGLTYDSIIDHLHHANWLLCEVERMEIAWLLFQHDVLKIKKPTAFAHATKMKNILAWVQTQQFCWAQKIPNYNRKLVLLFRLFHGQTHKRFFPKLRWDSENDWAHNMKYIFRLGCTERNLHSILGSNPSHNSGIFYGCACTCKECVRYVYEAFNGQFIDSHTLEWRD